MWIRKSNRFELTSMEHHLQASNPPLCLRKSKSNQNNPPQAMNVLTGRKFHFLELQHHLKDKWIKRCLEIAYDMIQFLKVESNCRCRIIKLQSRIFKYWFASKERLSMECVLQWCFFSRENWSMECNYHQTQLNFCGTKSLQIEEVWSVTDLARRSQQSTWPSPNALAE